MTWTGRDRRKMAGHREITVGTREQGDIPGREGSVN